VNRRWICALAGALWVASIARAEPVMVRLSGRVLGGSGKHAVYVALWRNDGFLEHPAQQMRLDPSALPDFTFRVSPGRWALSAFEDRNGNGVLDMGTFGPKEPAGFWHSFSGWRKPKFDEVAASVATDTPNVTITLK
jgi:uncharacterized protein (DUF2141 family)